MINKPKLQRWLDEFGEHYSRAVVVLSLMVALLGPLLFKWPFFGNSVCRGSIYRGLGLMVAASPCALAAAPLAYATAISSLTRKGILLKGGHVLDALSACQSIAFDKTGTLTTGKLICKAIEPIHGHLDVRNGINVSSCCTPSCESEALAVAAAMEKGTTHPIGRAVLHHSVGKGKDLPKVVLQSFECLPGRGVFATLSITKASNNENKLSTAAIGSVEYISSLYRSNGECEQVQEAIKSSAYGPEFVQAALLMDKKWNWQTIVIGVSFLVFLLFAKYIGKKNRKLFWVPAIAPIISVILATFFVYITRADKQGVQIVKHIEQGINPSSVHKIYFTGPFVATGFKIGLVCGIVGLTEAVAIGRTFAAMKDYQLDGNKEMVALGTMNIVGSMTSCYVTTGSFSRSAVNFMAGCKTPVSNVVMSVVVLLTLLVITPLFKYTPNAILGSIIISAVIGLVDYEAAILIWKVDKLDFIACMGAFFGVVFVSVEIGLLIAVAISFAKILLQVTRPRTALLGNLPGTTIYRNTSQYPEAKLIPGVVIVRVDSAIYFSNSNYVRERILRWLTDEEDRAKAVGLPKISFLIVEMSPVIDIDTSGIHALEDLYKNLQKRDMQLILSNPGAVVIEKLQASKLTEHIGSSNIFLAVSDAVRFCTTKSMQEP